MNILLLADLIVNSGVGQYVTQLSEQLSYQGKVIIASPVIERQDISSSVIKEVMPKTSNFINYLHRLRDIIKKEDVDVVHCNHRKQVFIMKIYQLFYGKIPVVWTCHTVPYPNNFVKKKLGYYGHKVIAISSEAYDWIHQELGIEREKIDTIINGVDKSRLIINNEDKEKQKTVFFNKRGIPYNNKIIPRVIAMHGRINYVKGIDLFVEAINLLPEECLSKIVVLISGDTNVPYYKSLIETISKYHLECKIFFVGWINTCDILSVTDLMVMPSRREGFPLSAIEAFMMKVPLIRTRTGGYRDMKDYCVGIGVDNVNEIKDRILEWFYNPSPYMLMAENAYDFAMSNCTIELMAKKTLETYKRAVSLCLK